MSRGPLRAGEAALLVDHRGRHYLLHLVPGERFHYHNGYVDHDRLIGLAPGSTLYSSSNGRLRAFRPTLSDFILKMRRAATVIYPKDIGSILVRADVFPGAWVLEAGIGSGALAIALIRAVGPSGRVVSYEVRQDHAERAQDNIVRFFGEAPPHHEIRLGDIALGLSERSLYDRVVLDLPEPWQAAPVARETLVEGGIWCSYVPTVPQIQRTVDALDANGFGCIETVETLERRWNVAGMSVRPDHRMVAHTGFLTTSVLLSGPAK
jgi:tRNA (adenine57-N1/adenine58-N1)-methyltransferase catalytic subunit